MFCNCDASINEYMEVCLMNGYAALATYLDIVVHVAGSIRMLLVVVEKYYGD